jgi:hypothetical protein
MNRGSNVREHIDYTNAESSSDRRVDGISALLHNIHANNRTAFVLTRDGTLLGLYQVRRISCSCGMPRMIFMEKPPVLVPAVNGTSMP